MNIELEYRTLLSEDKFLNIKKTLTEKGIFLGNDSKHTIFYIWDDRLGKVVYNDATKVTKLSMKLGRISESESLEEIEFYLDYSEKASAERLLETFTPKDIQKVYQFRDNYQYKGIDLAVKYTQSWGFHMELEKIIHEESEKAAAEQEIRIIAEELGCVIMTTAEVKTYTEKMDKGHNYGKYSEADYPYK
jgi:predicted adenylyl cyclase CyaB